MSVKNWMIVLVLCCVGLSPAAQPASSPASAPGASQPSSQPASSPATRPVRLGDSANGNGNGKAASQPARCILFSYANIPYNDVIRSFAEKAARKPIIGDVNVEGSLTFHDSEPYTYEEAFDTLNLLLAMRGYTMQESGRFLTVQRIGAGARPKYVTTMNADSVRPNDLVTMVLPLKFIDANLAARAAGEIAKTASIASLPKGKGILITDRMVNVNHVREVLAFLDAGDLVDQQLKTYTLKKAPAASVADLINSLFGPNRPRRMVWNEERGRSMPDGSETGEYVTAKADTRTNMLLLSGASDKLAMVEQMIGKLDTDAPLDSGEVRIFKLTNARADDVANLVRQLQPQPQFQPGGPRPASPARVVADSGTNSVIATGSLDQMQILEKLVKELDQKDAKVSREIKVLQLKSGDARQLADSLRRLFDQQTSGWQGQRTGGLRVEADAATNSLLVAAGPADWPKIQEILKQLEASIAPTTVATVKVVALKNAKSSELAQTLRQTYAQQPRSQQGRQNSTPPVVITSSDRTNGLLISACDADQQALGQLIALLDVPLADANGPASFDPVVIVRLKSGDAQKLAQTLQALAPRVPGQEVYIQPDPSNSVLLIRAPEAQRKMLEEIISKVDEETRKVARMMRQVRLKGASAQAMAAMLTQLYQNVGATQGRARGLAIDPAAEAVLIVAAPDDKTLIIDAPKSKVDSIVELAAAMDVEYAPSKVEVRIYQLAAANAGEVAPTLSRLFQERQGPQPRGTQNPPPEPAPKFEVDAGSNRLLVAAAMKQFETIDKLVQEIDKDSGKAGGAQIVKLKNADAQVLAGIVASAASRRDPRGQVIPGLSVSADVRTNSLVVAGAAGDVQTAMKLVEMLDTPMETAANTVRIVQLSAADATKVAATLAAMIPPPPRGQPQDTFVQSDANTNSILLRAPEAQRKTVMDMIAELDKATLEDARVMQVVALKGASAQAMAAMLSQFYQSTASARKGRGDPPQAFNPAEAVILSAAPDDRTLVVEAPKHKIEAVLKLIEGLDGEIAPGKQDVRIYQLANANASDLGPTLSRLLSDNTQRRPGQQQTAVNEPAPKVEADASNNRLLVAAVPRQFERIDKLVADLDKGSIQAGGTRIVRLKDADAQALATVVANAASRRDARGQILPGLSVSPDARTNSLVVAGVAGDVQAALKLIESMDVPTGEGADQIQVVQLKAADAAGLARTLQAMLPAPTGGKPQEVFVQADPTNSVLLIRAPQSQRKLLEEMIKKLDVMDEVVREMRTVKLKGASAQALAAMLSQLYQSTGAALPRRGSGPTAVRADAVIVTAGPDDRTLVIDAPRKKIEDVIKLATSLDMDLMPTAMQFRTYALKSGSASDVAPMLSRLFAQQQAKAQGQAAGVPEPQPKFEAEPVSNQIFVAATVKQFETIEKLIQEVDSALVPNTQAMIFRLKYVHAANLLPVLQTMLTEPSAPGSRKAPDPSAARVAALSDGNAVVVNGNPSMIARAKELITTLDTEDGAGMTVQIVQLKNAQAKTLADAINQTLSQQSPAAGGPTGKRPNEADVAVTPELNSNSLLIRGPTDKIQSVMEMIRKLDDAGTSSGIQVRTFTLQNSDATELARSIEKFFRDLTAQAGRTRMEPVPFSISADERTNSLFVSTTAANFSVLENLLKKLDETPDRPSRDVQYFWLTHADPTDVASKVNSMYADRRGADKPTVEADTFSNAVTVIAGDADLKAIEQVITRLDNQSKGMNLRVRVIPLTQAKADRMAQVLQRVYGQMTDASIEVTEKLPPRATMPAREGADPEELFHSVAPDAVAATQPSQEAATGPAASTAPAEAPSGKPKVVIAVDRASNALIISGTRQDLENIQALVDQLSATSDKETDFRVYPVKNADPTTIARMLNDLFNPKPAFIPGMGQPQPRQPRNRGGGLDQPVTPVQPAQMVAGGPAAVMAVADVRTKTLFVRAKPLDFDVIEAVIKTLDQKAQMTSEVKVFVLKNADATEVAANLRDLFHAASQGRQNQGQGRQPNMMGLPQDMRVEMVQRMIEMQVAGGMTQAEASNLVTVSANRNTNTVVVAASTAEMELIGRIVLELDQTAGTSKMASVRMYVLKQAEVQPIVQALRELFAQARQGPRGQGSADMPIIVTGDEAGRMVVVSATPEKHELIAKVIKDMGEARTTDPVTVKVYRLQHADPNSVAAALLSMTSDARGTGGTGRRPAAGGAGGTGLTRISADPSTASLVVRATKEEHDRIAKLLVDLDTVPGAQFPIQTIPLANADATNVAGILNRVFGQPSTGRAGRPGQGAAAAGQTILIESDKDSRLLTVRADDETFQKIRALTAQLDAVPPAGAMTPTLITLKNAQAATVAAVLQQAFAQPRTGQRPSPDDQVTVVGEPFSNSVVITANAKRTQQVALLLEKLDVDTEMGAKTDFYVLKKARATDVANALSKIVANVGPRGGRPGQGNPGVVVVSPEPGGNVLVFSGPAAELEKLRTLITELDKIVPESATDTKVLALKTGQAASVAQALTGAFAPARGKTVNPEDSVTVVAEAGSNSVVVTANALNMKKVEDLVKVLDQPGTNAPSVYTIQLKNGDAAATATMVRDLFTQATQGAKQVDPLGVTADDRANALVLATTKETYAKVSEWVAKLEEMKPARGSLRLIQIQNADPADIDRAIRQLYNMPGSPGPAGTPGTAGPRRPTPAGTSNATTGGRVETSVLPGQKSIMIGANDEDFAEIVKIIKQMEGQALAAKREIKVFTLKNASNTKVAQALDQVYRQAASGKAVSPMDLVTIQALAQTNAVVVVAAKEKMGEIQALIEQLDKQENSPQIEYRIFPLANASPTKILPTLRQLIAPLVKQRPEEPITVEGDERTKSIIVSARAPVFEQITKMIEGLDKAPEAQVAKTDMIFIQLKHADARQLATVMNDMLKPGAAGQVTPEARALQEQIRLLNVKAGLQDKIPELDLTKPIKISSDPAAPQGSNTLIVNSTEENLKALRVVVETLDVVPLAEGVVMRLVHLQNSDAGSLLTVLKDIFSQGKQLAGQQGTTVWGKAEPSSESGKALVNPLGVSADLRTNTLVLSGRQETIALAEILVKDLDRDEGKFVTEVRLFQLKNADAARMVPMLQAVFNETTAVPGSEGVRSQVTRLKTVLDKQGGNQSALPKGRNALVIQADSATNILIVAARNDVMPLICDVVASMDLPGAGSLNSVRFYPLQNADATRLQALIASMYTGPNAQNVRAEDKPTVGVDTRTNALIVAASEKTFAALDEMLKKLDAKLPIDLRDIKLVPLKNASSDTLAASLQKMMDARVQRLATMGPKEAEALKVIVLSDPRSNSLMVGGSAEGFELVKSLAQQLDEANSALGGQVQVYALVNGNAGTVSATLANLFNQRYQAARTPDIQRQKPVILPDPRSNALLVAANEDDSKVLKGLLEKLDVKRVDPTIQLVVLPMKHHDAGTVGAMTRQIFASRLTSITPAGTPPDPTNRVDVAAEPLSNALIVSASKDNIEMIKGLLEKVDIEPPSDTGVVKIYVLKTADATSTANLLQGLVRQGLYKPSLTSAANNPAITAREKVSIASDIRTNTLIVSASKENMAVIEQILKELDTDVASLMGDVRIYTLQRADATKLAAMLQQFFNAKRQGEMSVNNQAKTVPVVVVPDSRTNSLLVAGGKDSFASVEDMIKKLDGVEVTSVNDFRVFYLKNATATAIQPMLTQLFAQRATRGTGPKDPITVVADPKNNALILGATIEDMKLAEGLIAKLDVAETNGAAMQVFALKKANATSVAATIKSLMSAQGGVGAGPAAAGLAISVDDRTNSLIVSAGASDMERIKDLISKLDLETVAKVSEIRVYTLQNADAKELATVLTDVLTSKPKSAVPDNSNRQQLLQFITHTKEGKDLIASGLQEGVTITPDSRTNSLILSAPLEFMALLDSLVRALDQTSPRIAEIRMFALQNADAAQMATVLTQLFRLQQANAANAKAVTYTLVASQPAGGSGNGNGNKPDPANPPAGNGGETTAGPSATVGNAEQAALTVTVDIRTNSLLVGGTRQYVELASKVIEELDCCPAQERKTEVYRLRNVQANDVQTALQNFLDRERQKVTQSLGATGVGAAQRLLEQEVAVVAVPSENTPTNSNTLLLSASPRYFDTIKSLIRELDQAPPQVLIQVLLAEVTLDDSLDLGLDWSYQHKFGDANVKAGTNFGIQAEIQKFNGFNVSVTGGDINFFLRALATQGKVEVLSRPMIMGADNKKAMINVGEEVAFITDSRITETNTTFNTVQYKPVGVTLNVTPRINPDGLVKMDINPKISSLSQSSVTISPGVNAPIINSREALTSVTVQDGHTIVLGGLIQTTMETHDEKVPVLGDIPLLGVLFKKTTKTKQRKELLIILTPHVVRNGDQSDCQTDKEVTRLNKVLQDSSLKEIKSQMQNGWFSTPCPTTGPAAAESSVTVPIISGWPNAPAQQEAPVKAEDPPAAASRPSGTRILPVEMR